MIFIYSGLKMDEDDSDKQSEENSLEPPEKKRKKDVSCTDSSSVTCYTRAHLHRKCKLVIKDTGQCLFAIQRELNVTRQPRRSTLPKLPPEIWLKIFSYITSERQYPFMIR